MQSIQTNVLTVLCVPECPENAIFAYDDVPENQKHFILLNAELSKIWPAITKSKESMLDHEKWVNVANKLQYLKRD